MSDATRAAFRPVRVLTGAGRLAYNGGDRGVQGISRGCMTVSGLQKVAYLVLLVLIVAAAAGLLGGPI